MSAMVFIESVFALHLQILKHSPTCILPGISHVCIPAQRLVMSFIYEHNPFWFRNHVGRILTSLKIALGHSSVVSTGSVEPAFFLCHVGTWVYVILLCSVCVSNVLDVSCFSPHAKNAVQPFFYTVGLQHCDNLSL